MHKDSITVRTCAGCKLKTEKGKLYRYIAKGEVLLEDMNGLGRGVYLCGDCKAIYLGDESKQKRYITGRMQYELHKKKASK